MKNRSHRLPISDQLDDWVDGSWTVDCACGVNFDDGEEMVNCDECGVWVHTRCSRYVKSEKSFACDKCKSKSSRNNSEETEVAQLLVELPTKTLRMENPNPSFGREPPRRPFRLWTDIPMEDRVHVQGVPGGDTSLFSGISSVFSPELWKCTGHVPKKFNFQYKEFPCWDEKKEDDKKTDEENENLANLEDENPANKGAGVLFSLSKENGLPNTPMGTFLKRQVGEGGCERKKKEKENGVKKDKSSFHPTVIHSGKRKKYDQRNSKDQIGKKKARNVDKDGDSKKKGHTSKSVLPTMSSDAKQLEFYEDRGSKIVKAFAQCSKRGLNSRGENVMPADSLSDSYQLVEKDDEKSLAFSDISRHNSSTEARPKEENAGARLEITPKTDGLDHNDSGSVPIKEEVVGDDRNKQNDNKGSSGRCEEGDPNKSEPPEIKEDKKTKDSNGDVLPNSSHPNGDSKSVADSKMDFTDSLDPHYSADKLSENVKVIDSGIDCSKSNSDLNDQVTDKNTVVSDCQTDNNIVGPESSRKNSSEELLPSKSSAAPPSQRKIVISVGKSSSTSSTVKASSTKSKKENNPSSTDKIKNDKKLSKDQHQTKSASRIPHSVSKRSSNPVSPPVPEPIESAGSLHTEMAQGLPQRGGKMNHSNSHTAPMHPPPAPLNSQANLSDEELALLLHQELNSSPRVPRVPRMRHSGSSLPQLGSPTSTSTLMKRTSSGGGKDHPLVLRRKNKDLAKDGSRNPREVDGESQKADRVTSSSDRSKHDTTADPLTKGEAENGSVKGAQSVAKSIIPLASTTTASSGPSSSTEANEQNMSSTRSPQNASDEDTGTVGRATARTLPGLIADIMSKGKRMTYEELCNAVLPHWPNLRKHNGERYAYSSHSQAVLDCLRNRSEWARLVDRGPKTNASRKRRKPDAEHSEDNEYTVGKEIESSKSLDSNREKFPKKKLHQVRKRRRLSKQRTTTNTNTAKEVRRRHKAKVVSDDDYDDEDDNDDEDDDVDSYSNSTEEAAAFSEDDEIQGAVEASASSDETENML